MHRHTDTDLQKSTLANKLTAANLFEFLERTHTHTHTNTHTHKRKMHTNKGLKCFNTDKNTDALCAVTSRQ